MISLNTSSLVYACVTKAQHFNISLFYDLVNSFAVSVHFKHKIYLLFIYLAAEEVKEFISRN